MPASSLENNVYEFICIEKSGAAHLAQKSDVSEEFIFLNHNVLDANSTQRASSIKQSCLSWSPASLLQLEKKMKALRRPAEATQTTPKRTCVQLSVEFDSGQKCHLLFLPGGMSSIEIKNKLREFCSKSFEAAIPSSLFINVSALKKDYQVSLIKNLAALSKIAQWARPAFGKRAEKKPRLPADAKSQVFVSCLLDKKSFFHGVNKGLLLGEANNLVRYLADLPTNYLTPKIYVKLLEERARERQFKFEFFDKKKLEAMNAGAFLAVIRGSHPEDGGIAHLSFGASKTTKKKKIVLVGKGLCYDTGGYDIKTSGHMNTMHRDMTGSAVALSIFELLYSLKAPYEVHAYLAIAENLISADAYKPNEVVTASDGTSIEVVNTDAEGRMVLADTLAVCRKLKADLTIDFGTLTGGAVRAIGTQRAAVFSNRSDLLETSFAAGEASGERVWTFPIGDEFEELLKSDFADVLQCLASGPSDHILAATFLSRFIGDENPWVHCDLSCEANKGGLGLAKTETTGYGAAWGLELIERYFKNSF